MIVSKIDKQSVSKLLDLPVLRSSARNHYYRCELPSVDATANLGDAGHRWITVGGPIDGNKVLMNIELTSGGIFDTATEITRTNPPGSDGTVILTFDSCNSGTIEYDITSINRQGIIPIQRVAGDSIALCEVLNAN